jgi:FHA domain
MTDLIVSLIFFVFTVSLTAGVLLVPVAFVAGNVFHVWGTTSVLEWLSEAFLRIFSGSLRRRLMRAVNRQTSVGVDKSRRTHPYLAVSVSPGDVSTLTGPGGDLAGLAADAVKGYARHARAQGWSPGAMPQIAVVPEELLRRGSVRVRPVSGKEFIELWREMADWDEAVDDDHVVPAPAPAPATRVGQGAERLHTKRLSDDDVMTVEVKPFEAVTEAFGSAEAVTMPAASARIVLGDAHGGQHPITSESVLIGRGRECGVRLESAEVSREHVGVYFQEGMWWLRDRGSRNGTTVDGRQVKGTGPVQLRKGSQIVLGGEKAGEKLMIAELEER